MHIDIRNYALPGGFSADVLPPMDVTDHRRGDRRVRMKVHYPLQAGKFPVVVFSHGAGGSCDTHFAQAHHLATYGFNVICVEHPGSCTAAMLKVSRPLAWMMDITRDANEVMERPRDISFAVDCAAKWNKEHPVLRNKVDVANVGVVGHSFGACSAMMACGVRVSTKWLRPVVDGKRGLAADRFDKRLKCGIALSPQGPGEPFFVDESYSSLRVPLLGVSGSLDRVQNGQPPESRMDAFSKWPAGAHQFVWLNNARHVDFTDATGSGIRMLDSPSRRAVQPALLASMLIFLNEHLYPVMDNGDRLSVSLLRRYLTGAVDRVSVIAKPAR